MPFIQRFINRFAKPAPKMIFWEEETGTRPEVVHPSTPPGWRSVGRYCGR